MNNKHLSWYKEIQRTKFKSIWGLMLGILPLGVNRLGEVGLTPWVVPLYLKYMKTDRDASSRPRAQTSLRPVDINRHWYVNLCCKIEVAETEPDMIMSRPRSSVNRRASTHVYKGTTRRRFKKDRQQLETQAKRIRSLVIETPSIPSQLDVGFYLHRKGPNQYKLLASFVLL